MSTNDNNEGQSRKTPRRSAIPVPDEEDNTELNASDNDSKPPTLDDIATVPVTTVLNLAKDFSMTFTIHDDFEKSGGITSSSEGELVTDTSQSNDEERTDTNDERTDINDERTDTNDERTESFDESTSGDDDIDYAEVDPDSEDTACECFICDVIRTGYNCAEEMKGHLESAHGFKLQKLKRKFLMTFEDFDKFLRWARHMKRQSLPVTKDLIENPSFVQCNPPWKDFEPDFVLSNEQPVDFFLTLDLFVSQGTSNTQRMMRLIERLQKDNMKMKEVVSRFATDSSESQPTKPITSLGKKSDRSDNSAYFESYDETCIHHEMIFDRRRTDAYQLAIERNKSRINDKIIMDVGCGTGILSMLCAKQGAKKVHAIDKSRIILEAVANVYDNNLASIIQCHNGDVDTSDFEIEGKVDVMVSEFMGYFLFFEGMTETFIRARDKFLKKGGVLLPNFCQVSLVPMGRTGLYNQRIDCWSDVYGFKMCGMKARAVKEIVIDTVKPEDLIGEPVKVKVLDLETCSESHVYINSDFGFKINKTGELCGIAGYFSVDFPGDTEERKTELSTDPWLPPTHWKQTIFFLRKPISVTSGDVVQGRIKSVPHPENPRELSIKIKIGSQNQTYEFLQ